MAHPVDIHVGRRLRQIRAVNEMSQTDVAELLGMSFQQVQKYEAATNRIAASRLFELAQIFGVKPDYFFIGLEGGCKDELTELKDGTDCSLVAG